MAGLEELKKKLVPLFDAEKGFSSDSALDPSDSYMVIAFPQSFSISFAESGFQFPKSVVNCDG